MVKKEKDISNNIASNNVTCNIINNKTDVDNTSVSEQIYIKYKQKIYGYMSSKGVQVSDRDDVFSEILLKAVKQEHRYDSNKSSVSTWVYVITRSAVYDYFRKFTDTDELSATLVGDTGIDTSIEYEEQLEELSKQLARLPERERQVIILRLYKDMDYNEIAKATNLTVVNARVLYSRAIKKLKARMIKG